MFKIPTHFTVFLLYCVCNGSEVRDITLYVNDDGSVQKPQKLPDFSPGKIKIIESSYCRREWYGYYGCPTNNKEPFSPAAEYHLHQMCSWRERCLDGLKFPFKSFAQNKRTNAVNIKYTCSDAIVNMCTTATTHFREPLYVTIESVSKYQACECHLNNGYFSVFINDLRLTSKTEETTCSPAEFMINSDQSFVCMQDNDGFGSIFHSKVIDWDENAFIAIKSNTPHADPAMVLFTVFPEAKSRIECGGRKPWSTSANTAITRNHLSPYTASSSGVGTDVVTQPSTTVLSQHISTPNPLPTTSTTHETEPSQGQDTEKADLTTAVTVLTSLNILQFAVIVGGIIWYKHQHPETWNKLKRRICRSDDIRSGEESHKEVSDKSHNETSSDNHDNEADTSSFTKVDSDEQSGDNAGNIISLDINRGRKGYKCEEHSEEIDLPLQTDEKRPYVIGNSEPLKSNSNSSLTSPGDCSEVVMEYSDVNNIPSPALSS